MSSKTYRPIAAGLKILKVLDIIALSTSPITVKEITEHTEEPYGTVMTHITTLEHAGYVERIGDGYITTLKLGTFWAKKKASLQSVITKAQTDLQEIGA